MSKSPFKAWVALLAIILWNVPAIWLLFTVGEKMAILAVGCMSLLGALLLRGMIWAPASQRFVVDPDAESGDVRVLFAKISNGLLLIGCACVAVYAFLSID